MTELNAQNLQQLQIKLNAQYSSFSLDKDSDIKTTSDRITIDAKDTKGLEVLKDYLLNGNLKDGQTILLIDPSGTGHRVKISLSTSGVKLDDSVLEREAGSRTGKASATDTIKKSANDVSEGQTFTNPKTKKSLFTETLTSSAVESSNFREGYLQGQVIKHLGQKWDDAVKIIGQKYDLPEPEARQKLWRLIYGFSMNVAANRDNYSAFFPEKDAAKITGTPELTGKNNLSDTYDTGFDNAKPFADEFAFVPGKKAPQICIPLNESGAIDLKEVMTVDPPQGAPEPAAPSGKLPVGPYWQISNNTRYSDKGNPEFTAFESNCQGAYRSMEISTGHNFVRSDQFRQGAVSFGVTKDGQWQMFVHGDKDQKGYMISDQKDIAKFIKSLNGSAGLPGASVLNGFDTGSAYSKLTSGCDIDVAIQSSKLSAFKDFCSASNGRFSYREGGPEGYRLEQHGGPMTKEEREQLAEFIVPRLINKVYAFLSTAFTTLPNNLPGM